MLKISRVIETVIISVIVLFVDIKSQADEILNKKKS